ncbi:hypothetical protein B0H16DRAFT_1697666 [Mycena metata]|uniref:Uncharacterized protein n=1 Tax=Mycena metata TaxID=1033252 RepID=A0AAD7HSU9_9AGAR|nr:hypothetical protein B0H16DRAFT_1697666 [Mycena metata]
MSPVSSPNYGPSNPQQPAGKKEASSQSKSQRRGWNTEGPTAMRETACAVCALRANASGVRLVRITRGSLIARHWFTQFDSIDGGDRAYGGAQDLGYLAVNSWFITSEDIKYPLSGQWLSVPGKFNVTIISAPDVQMVRWQRGRKIKENSSQIKDP